MPEKGKERQILPGQFIKFVRHASLTDYGLRIFQGSGIYGLSTTSYTHTTFRAYSRQIYQLDDFEDLLFPRGRAFTYSPVEREEMECSRNQADEEESEGEIKSFIFWISTDLPLI